MISIGIDAAKGKSTVCILKLYGELFVPPRDVSHTESELESLIFLIRSFGAPVKALWNRLALTTIALAVQNIIMSPLKYCLVLYFINFHPPTHTS